MHMEGGFMATKWPSYAQPVPDSDGGYRSGRSSERETPEMDSRARTRSAGTLPLDSHLYTAWYRTPHSEATFDTPPAPMIARPTGVPGIGDSSGPAGKVCAVSMHHKLQPIVASRQQPEVSGGSSSMQPMVVSTKEQVRAAFAGRLNALLERRGVKKWGRPARLYEILKAHNGGEQVVSKTACQNYLNGDDLPDEANKAILADALQVSQWELYEDPARLPDPATIELLRYWNKLSDSKRGFVLQAAKVASGDTLSTPTAAPEELKEHTKRKRK